MKFLIIFTILIVSIFANTQRAIVGVYSELPYHASSASVCGNYNTKKEMGVSQYDKCIKEYETMRELEKYFKNSVKSFLKNSSKIKMKLGLNNKDDYELHCTLGMIIDEIKMESGFYRGDDEPIYKIKWHNENKRGIYYMQFDCTITNVKTNEEIEVYEHKTKLSSQDGIVDTQRLIKEGKRLIKRGFPKVSELEKTIEENIKFNDAVLKYTYANPNKKVADGKERGKIEITNIVNGFLSDKHNLSEFKLSAKQGKIGNSKELTFTDKEFKNKGKKLSFDYTTYNCYNSDIANREFETFTLSVNEQLSQKNPYKLKTYKVKFECPEPFFTIKTVTKTIAKHKPLENYKGINKTLKSYEKDTNYYYVYIDENKGIIKQAHIDRRSTRVIHREQWELNGNVCRYELKSEERKVKNLGGGAIFKSQDSGWGIDDSSKFYVDLPESNKQFGFLWGRLKNNRYLHKEFKYKQFIPKMAIEFNKYMQGFITNYRDSAKNSKELDNFKSIYPNCRYHVSLDTILIPPVDITYVPDVEYQITIRPSTQNEIKVAKRMLGLE